MSQAAEFDLEAFQTQVVQEVVRLEKWSHGQGWPAVMGDDPRARELAETGQQAEALLQRQDVRAQLCPALNRVADDAFEIGKTLTPVLISLALAGSIAIPLTPLFVAVSAILIARIGISTLCAGYEPADKKG
jgi:hypothetical protein